MIVDSKLMHSSLIYKPVLSITLCITGNTIGGTKERNNMQWKEKCKTTMECVHERDQRRVMLQGYYF